MGCIVAGLGGLCPQSQREHRESAWRQPDALCTQYLHLRKGLRLPRRGALSLGYYIVPRLVCLRQRHDKGRRPGCERRLESACQFGGIVFGHAMVCLLASRRNRPRERHPRRPFRDGLNHAFSISTGKGIRHRHGGRRRHRTDDTAEARCFALFTLFRWQPRRTECHGSRVVPLCRLHGNHAFGPCRMDSRYWYFGRLRGQSRRLVRRHRTPLRCPFDALR